MRIAFWHDLPTGGGFRAMSGQLHELHALGHETAVWTPASADTSSAADWIPRDVPINVIPFPDQPRAGYMDRRFDTYLDRVQWRIDALSAQVQRCCDAMIAWKADIVLAHPCVWFHTSPIGAMWPGTSVLYLQEPYRGLHEAWPLNPWALAAPTARKNLRSRVGAAVRDWRSVQAKRMQVRSEIDWAFAFDRVLVNSLYSRESVLRSYGLEAHYCPLGVDHAAFASARSVPKERLVVSLGELSLHKGPMLAVQAVGAMPAASRPLLRWFGNRADEGYLREVAATASQLGVDFKCERMTADAYLADQLSRAACMIYCPRLEPLGFAPLEANLAGTVAVGVAEGGIRETIIEGVNGSLVNGRDPVALASAMSRYTDDLDLASRAGITARQHVMAHHNWATAGKALETHLFGALAASRGAGRA